MAKTEKLQLKKKYFQSLSNTQRIIKKENRKNQHKKKCIKVNQRQQNIFNRWIFKHLKENKKAIDAQFVHTYKSNYFIYQHLVLKKSSMGLQVF